MSWMEEGGPKVAAPAKKGFGQMVIGRMVEAAVQGITETVFHESGLTWNLSTLAEEAVTQGGEGT
jgi:hypothetical protein